jgi:hypothetical protein
MAIDIATEVVIRRPRSEVAGFMFDPANEAIWTTGVVESKPFQEGRFRKGARVERVSKFLGKRLAYVYEIEDADADSFVAIRVQEPFPMRIRYELEDAAGGGTVARIRAAGEPGGFFGRVAAPLMSRMVKRNITSDLETLKEYLEADGGTV